jgi:hypothetical protein
MSNPKMFAQWILDNQDKQGTEDFNLVAQAFEKSLQDEQALQQPEEKPFGVAEYAQAPLELGKAVTRGLGGALLSSAAGLAELADIATDRLGFEDLIDSGEDNELIRLANAGQEALQETLGASEPYRDLWFTKFGEGVGSVGAFFLPTGLIGAAGRAAGLAAKTTTGLQTAGAITAGGGMMVDDSVNRVADARLRGIEVTKDQEDAAAALSFLVGGLEAFTPLQVLKKIRGLKDPELAKQQFDAIRSVIKTGTGEGIQEVTSGLLMDAIQYGLYDENVPFGESMWDDFTIGAASGALVDAITTGMFNRRSRLSREIELDREKLIRETEEREREDYYNRVALAEESLKERDIQNQLDAIAAQEDAELAAADVLNFQVDQSEQEALLGLIAPYQPSQEALRQPKGDIEGRDIESTVTKQGREYARQIARNASKKTGLFPSTGRFEIREEQGGPSGTNYVVYNTADGRQYGQATKDLEFAKHFSLGLNNEMINKSVNESIIDAMDMSPETYDPKTAESIFMIGQRLNRPKSYTISEATLNEAAGTVASKDKPFLENLTLDQIHQIQYGVPPFQDGKKKLYKDLSNLTASQQINFERAKKGLPPLREFTLQEAKDALGDKYDKVFDVLLDVQQPDLAAIRQEFGEAGVNVQGGRQRYQDEINTLKEVKDTLASKNIVSDIGSKELSYVFKKITGESSVSKMTPSQRMFLVGELKRLPALDKPSKLPDLSPKPYTRADFNNAMNYVISTGDGTVDNIKAVLPEDLSEKRKSVAAGQIRAELLSRGVINKDNTVSELTALPAPEPRKPTEVTEKDFTVEQSVEALDFQKKLSEKLKGMGLDDIRVRILDQMKTAPDITREGRVVSLRDRGDFSAAEGLFDTGSRTIFLGLDSARASARDQSPEAIDFALSEVMDHEIVHALRNLDLWTQKEFSLLENAARKLKMPGTNKTFYQDAVERYVTQQKGPQKRSPVQAMEEAIAEMVRYSKKDRKIIGGKPRNLIDRIFEFFRRLGSAMQGTGFNSMNDLINNIESGALGARERGVVRTARGMETARRAVPERGIGLARDVKTEFTTRTEVTGRDGSSATTTVTRDIPVAGEDEQPVEGGVQMSAQRASDSYKGPVKPYHMDEWTQETGLSPQEIEGFWKLGYDQRGKPEQLMMKAQKEMGGGVLSQAIEHVGDLTNRMTPNHSLGFAYEESLGKAQRILRDLKREYGFRKEAEENLRNAAEYYNIPLEEYKSKVNSALDAYADAHEELVTYNPLQTLARDAAVALGRRDFEKATELLQEFVDRIPTQKDFVAEMTRGIPVAGEGGVQMSINRIIGRNGTELNQAPDGKTAHGLPSELLVDGPKQKAKSIVVQNFTPQNTDQVLSNIQTVKSNNPDALGSTENWIAMEDDAFGGDFVPIPPLKAIQYAQSPELLAEKLKQLTPDLKAGVDEGFKYVQQIKNLYNTQPTSPDLTGRLFMWGLLSRGAGPVQQEFAFLNLLKAATPYIKKASEGKMTQADVINWKRLVGKSIPSGSPAKSVTMNANDIGKLLFELGKVPEGSSQTVMQTLHNMLADPNISGKEFRNEFFRLTNKPGVDNKVVSFIALVAGKDDVLVMDRIQGRHLWNDGRFGDKNIYDGLKKGKVKGGLNAIFAGPRGLLVTESLEDGLSSVVQQAYDMIGRPQDASVGRMHWETWVIDGNQAVSHSTLEAVRTGKEIGGSVTEGKRGTFSSGTTYRQTANGPITEYPLSDGTVARMTLDQQKEFEAFIKNPKNGIIPKGFLVGRSKDRPWFELPEVNREKLDEAARRFENANPDGSIRSGNARSIRAGASDAGRRRAAAGPVGSVEAPATDEISSSLKRVDGIIERNPAESITRIYDESATRPFLEEQEINGYPPFSWQAKTYSRGDKIIYQAADKLVGLKKAEEEINRARALAGLPPIKNKDSAYVGEESIPGKIGIEVKDFQENVQRPYAKKIADSGIPIEELDEFLTFRHAVERNNRIQLRDPSRNVETNPGSGSLKTGERLSNFYVKQIMENRYGYEWDDASESWVGGNDRGKKLMGLAADADSIVNSTIDRMIKGGLLSKDNAEALRGLYKYYAPLKGKAQEDDFADFVAVGSGLSTKGKEYKMALGRESASESPLGHIMLNAERTIARSVKNESFGQKLVKLIKDNPNSDFWNVYSSSDPRFKQAVDTHYTYIGKESGMQGQRYPDIPKGMDRKDFVKYVVIKQDGLAKFDGDLIGAKDGEEFFVELKDERLRRAILSVNASEADNLIRKFSMVNRFLSMMNTSLNPEFVVGNFSRDLQTAIYNIVGEQTMQGGKIKDVKRITRRVLKDVIPSMGIVYKGMRRYNMKDGTLRSNITGISEADYLDFREFMESGAKADWFYTRPAEEQVQTIQSMVDMANGTFTGNFRKGYEGVMNFVEDANSSVENAVRFAAFKAARDELLNSGVDRAEAVATASTLAKNLTVNFNRKGMQGDLLNALYLFYNASVQGTMNFARGLNVFDPGSSRTKQAMVASMIGFGALMAARGEEESEENPDSGRSYYSEIPDYIKERNIVIMAEPSEAPKKGASNIYLDKNGKEYANKAQYYYTIPLPYGYKRFPCSRS